MRYMPLSPDDVREMLSAIGVKTIDDLFAPVPKDVRFQGALDIPEAMSEVELRRHVRDLADENYDATKSLCFAGGTGYYHYIPSAVNMLSGLPELLTAYTPYQPELSQGILMAIFEFQTLMTELTGLAVSNASLYDGSTAVCEAARMAVNQSGKNVVSISSLVHPSYIDTLKSFASFLGYEIRIIPATGDRTDASRIAEYAKDSACIIIQSPNVLGTIEDVELVAKNTKSAGSYIVQVVTETISFGLLKRPGDLGVDICCGDAQSFGNPLAFGGPYLGFMTCTEEFIRRLPGRIVGETTDRHGNTVLTLTLRPREQDIRREKATSNICTNNSNSMLRALIYLLLMGKKGVAEVARQNYDKAHYFVEKAKSAGLKIFNQNPFFNEVTILLPSKKDNFAIDMLQRGFIVSPTEIPGTGKAVTVAVTEMLTKEEIEAFVEALKEVAA